jgi:signal peptidase II
VKYRSALLLILLVLIIDQVSKVYIKTHFYLGEEVLIAGQQWARLHFLENEGMAFGLKISQSHWGKIVLTLFRLVAVVVGFVVLYRFSKRGYSRGVLVCGSLILAGALGNLVDSMFYGMIFSDSNPHLARFVSFGDGYAPFLHGKVVDMLYFPIAKIPLPGGRSFEFFEPVFNIADAAITGGVLTLIFFQKRFLGERPEAQQAEEHPVAETRREEDVRHNEVS